MKKRLLSLAAAFLLGIGLLRAIPAHPGKVAVTQPDGTTVTLQLHGDEYLHYTTTADGYTVMKDSRGFYVYARQESGRLAASQLVAHDEAQRTTAEKAFLASAPKHLMPEMTPAAVQTRKAMRARGEEILAARRAGEYDYSQFRGLLILVEYNDRSFSRSDYAEIMEHMVNDVNYTGYMRENGGKETYYGSVHDYFSDSSNGKFQPQFDIVGPVTVNYSQYDPKGTENAISILVDAINAADEEVDFSQYDGDGDGVVDLVYFIMAGNGANYGGNDQRLFWPHRSVIYDPNTYSYILKDNVYLGDYASSVELQGFTAYPSSVKIDGIGTICHEFSHVLGLPDFYDTNYAQQGQSADPGEWSLMSGGSYLNDSKNPVSYSLYEKWSVGFIGDDEVQLIDTVGNFSLENVATSHAGYRINTPRQDEYFMLENRQRTGWDAYLPGHGMLVFRVDESNQYAWWRNTVNADASHNYYELVRAGGANSQNAGTDPYPGRNGVTTLDNTTEPGNLLTWAGDPCHYGLANIKEQGGVVTFDVVDVNVLTALNMAETLSVPQGLALAVPLETVPAYAPYELTWTTSDPAVATVDEKGRVTGVSAGSAVITATDVAGLSASCTVSVFESATADNIAAFKAFPADGEGVLYLHDAQVVYKDQKNGEDHYFVRDATGSILLQHPGFDLKQNEVLNGAVYGKFSTDNRMPLLLPVDGLTGDSDLERAEGEEAQPRPVRLPELTDADLADLVTLQEVRVGTLKEGKSSYAMAFDGETNVFIYNRFVIKDLSMPKNYEKKLFDITGIYGSRGFEVAGMTYNDIYPVQKMKVVGDVSEASVSGIEVAEAAETQVYSIDGSKVKTAGRPGIYIVRKGEKIVKMVKPLR